VGIRKIYERKKKKYSLSQTHNSDFGILPAWGKHGTRRGLLPQ